jgi:hypothetical protein
MDESIKEQKQEDLSSGAVDFFGYISSLAFQAMIFLGEVESPLSGKIEKNAPQAKLLIDTLILLREKTKGNLNEQESRLLEAAIYELQIKFVESSKGEKANG